MNSDNPSLGTRGKIVTITIFKVHVVLTVAAGAISQAVAGGYYVGGPGASDRNPGTVSQPFATIQKAASVAVAGDSVNIRGGIYRETIVPANSGAPGQPVTFQPDGDAEVTVSGADTANGGWAVYRGNVYQKTIALPVTGYRERITDNSTLLANQVFVGSKMMIEARWPNVANSDDLLNRADFRPVPKDGWTTGAGTTLRDAEIPDIPGGWTGGTSISLSTTQSGVTVTLASYDSEVAASATLLWEETLTVAKVDSVNPQRTANDVNKWAFAGRADTVALTPASGMGA